MLERGYAVHFEDLACKVFDPQRREIAKVKMERNMSFPLIFPYANTAFKTEVVADSWLWHRRLGHLNFQSLKKLEQKKMVYGLPPIHELKEVCEGCALGKHNRGPFPKDQAWRAKAPLELVGGGYLDGYGGCIMDV